MRTLIITGDDFGISSEVNAAILEAHERGVLTSASLMVAGDAFEEAVDLARAHPRLAVGLHLAVLDGKAALSPGDIPDLVDEAGCFSRAPVAAGLRYQFSRRARGQLRREIRAQLERFRDTGLTLSHVDGHHHLHLHPVVLSCLADLAGEFRIPVIRLPSEELSLALRLDGRGFATKILWAGIFSRLRRSGERRLRSANVGFADRVYGLLATGRITEKYLLGLIPTIRASDVEIYSHPGANAEELEALLSPAVRNAVEEAGFSLVGRRSAG
ncbi:MAG: hopanoid biosynthesis-associated protein HpnK [Thermoanaerobaculia bacterium]